MPISQTTTWNKRGFTLVELTVVLTILALTVSLALPLFGKGGEADLHAAGRRLAATIKYLYNEAILEKVVYRLSFDLDHDTLRAEQQSDSGAWSSLPGRMGNTQLPGNVKVKQVDINGRGSFTSGEVSMQVYPVGWVDETVLWLQDGKHRQTLRVSSLTGTVEFYDGQRSFH